MSKQGIIGVCIALVIIGLGFISILSLNEILMGLAGLTIGSWLSSWEAKE